LRRAKQLKSFTYDGKNKKPTVTVKDSKNIKLKAGTDYTVKYASGRKNVGRYKVTITFKGNHQELRAIRFSTQQAVNSQVQKQNNVIEKGR